MVRFKSLDEKIAKSRTDRGAKIDNNTYARKINEKTIAIRFHDTDIITVNSRDIFTVDVGGFFTSTTKQRLNEYLPVYISQEKYRWFVIKRGDWHGEKIPFKNGIKINAGGKVISGAGSIEKTVKEKRLDKLITEYIKAFSDQLDTLPDPNGGDCFFCCGMLSDGVDHLLSHLKEKYLMLRVLFNAMVESGFPPMAYSVFRKDKVFVRRELKKYFRKRYHALLKEMK